MFTIVRPERVGVSLCGDLTCSLGALSAYRRAALARNGVSIHQNYLSMKISIRLHRAGHSSLSLSFALRVQTGPRGLPRTGSAVLSLSLLLVSVPLREDDAIGKENTRRGNKAEKRKKQQQQQHENPRMLVGCNSCAAHNNVSSPQHQTRFSYSLRTLQPIASPSRSLSLSPCRRPRNKKKKKKKPTLEERNPVFSNAPTNYIITQRRVLLVFFSFLLASIRRSFSLWVTPPHHHALDNNISRRWK